jgi:hypothetical protein
LSRSARRAAASNFGTPSLRQGASREQIFQAVWVTLASGVLFWTVWLYGSALRDARYLDGWLLAAAMALQVAFHVRRKTSSLSPAAALTWRQIHIVVGYVIIALFISHCDFSLPDTNFEWVLWICTVLVLLSGILGTYLTWAAQAKLRSGDEIVLDRIPKRRMEIAKEVHAIAVSSERDQLVLELPVAPYKEWILDFYKTQLKSFFKGPRNRLAHFVASQRHMKKLIGDIDDLERYVDKSGREKLNAIKALVIEKDRLDFADVQLRLSKAWLLVHVPVTYSLVVLIVLHILVVYAYSSGVW